MTLACEKKLTHIGESTGAESHDQDMIHELSKRLDAYWRYDQYIANAESDPDLKQFGRSLKARELDNIEQLKRFIASHCEAGCF